MTAQPARAMPAIIVSPDPYRAAVLATGFFDARLLSPDDAGTLGPPRDPEEVLVFPAGAAGPAVVESVRRQRPRAAQILVEVDSMEPAALRGLEFTGIVDVAGVSFWSLRNGRNDDVAPDLPTSSGRTESRPGRQDGQLEELDALRREVRRLAAELAAREAPEVAERGTLPGASRSKPAIAPIPPSRSPATARRPPAARRNVLLAGLVVSALLAVLISIGLAALTGTGYVGGLLTLLVLVVAVGFLALAALDRRRARNVARRERAASRTTREQRRLAQRDARRRIERVQVELQRELRTIATQQRSDRNRGERLERQLNVVGATVAEAARRPRDTDSRWTSVRTDAAMLTNVHQTQALLNLFALGPVRGVIPPMGGRDAAPDVIALLVQEMLTRRPGLVVECGSGVSTLWLALVAEWYALPTRIVALQHDRILAEQTRRTLTEHSVAHRAEVRHAALGPTELPGHRTPWYDRSVVADLEDIGLLFVDGPTEAVGPLVRWPAVPVLKRQLAPRTTIILDDLDRAGEQEVAARWSVALPEFVLERLPLLQGAARFRRG